MMLFAVSIGMAKLTPSPAIAFKLLMPITSPCTGEWVCLVTVTAG